jgi:two-component system, cell cycle sensor histidine kinase and response regulator CckA
MTRILNVLVVDDDTENADALAELFTAENHRVIVAYDGVEAVAAFQSNQVDIGFFDVMMPRQNGVDSFLEIRQKHPNARVYFMTGYSADDLLEKAKGHGALGVFSKPTDPSQLLDALEREAA